jgi:hypothetical protein
LTLYTHQTALASTVDSTKNQQVARVLFRRVYMGAIRVWLWAMVLLGPAGWVAYRVWPRELGYRAATLIPVCQQSGGRSVVTLPDRFLVAKVAATATNHMRT